MRRSALWAAMAVLAAGCASGPKPETKVGPGLIQGGPAVTATLVTDPRTLTFDRLKFEPPAPTLHRPTQGGATGYHVADTELPLLELALIVGLGGRDDPPDKPGVVELLERTLPVGGAGDRPAARFAETAEARAIEVHVSTGDDRTTVRVAALAKDAELAFSLLADLALRPRFDANRLEIERKRAIEAVRRRNDHPHSIGARELRNALYGPDSRWSRQPTQAQLAAVTRQDVIALHKAHFQAGGARIVVVGDLAEAEFKRLFDAHFGTWTGAAPARPKDDPSRRAAGPQRRLAVKPGGQAVILAGQRWLPRHHPDRHVSDLLNYILGGGVFQSRLGEAIRSDRGLAYSVSTGVRRLHDDVGYLYVFAGTKPSTQGEVLGLIHSVTDAMRAHADVTDDELAQAKDAFLNSHVFNFDTAYGVAVQQAILDHYGYAQGWLAAYPDRIAAVTAADIARVAKERLHPSEFTTVLVTPQAPAEEGWQAIDLEAAVR